MTLQGKCAVPGVAVGSIYIHNNSFTIPKESLCPAGEEQVHLDRYFFIKKQAISELDLIVQKLNDDPKAAIFIAHKEIVDDIIINEEIPAKIKNEQWAGDWAIYQVYETVLAVLKNTPDPLISERACDFDDVRSLLLRLWYGQKNEGLNTLTEPVIVAARELMPSDAAGMDKGRILAILTEIGGLTSHAAIIAKSYGIPTVLGITGLLDSVKQGQTAAVSADANKGTVILNPDKNTADEYQKKAKKYQQDKKEEQTYFSREGFTACGKKIDIGLNVANVGADLAAEQYVDSVSVFRTEFLYMGRNSLPSEDEQFEVYRKVLECFGERPVIIRTLDIGGDKQIAGMKPLNTEENPFLGVRALRLCFNYPDIFMTQIKAALRASNGNLWLMLPMVTSIEDIRKAKEYIAAAAEELKKEGITVSPYKFGIMIEIPSIALIADLAAKEVDFASIGSNDLCQYLCAADRMNAETEEYYQSYHPGMLRLLKDVISAFDNAGKSISICGELGGDPMAVPLLIGLGLRKLGMNASSIAAVKRKLAGCSVKQCEELAGLALACQTAAEVKTVLADTTLV